MESESNQKVDRFCFVVRNITRILDLRRECLIEERGTVLHESENYSNGGGCQIARRFSFTSIIPLSFHLVFLASTSVHFFFIYTKNEVCVIPVFELRHLLLFLADHIHFWNTFDTLFFVDHRQTKFQKEFIV